MWIHYTIVSGVLVLYMMQTGSEMLEVALVSQIVAKSENYHINVSWQCHAFQGEGLVEFEQSTSVSHFTIWCKVC